MTSATPRTRRWVVPALVAAAIALVLFSPFGWRCPIHAVTGFPCPTCGITRATRRLLALDAAGATAMHPLVWLVVPLATAYVLVELTGFVRTGTFGAAARVPYARVALVGTAALLFAVWIARFFGALGGPVP